MGAEKINQPVDFPPQRNRRRAAEEQTEDKKQSQPADAVAKNLFAVHGEFNRTGLVGSQGELFQAIRPVANEKLFFGRKEGVGFTDDWPESGRHLHGDEQEDDDPDIQARLRFGIRIGKSMLHKAHGEQRGHQPERKVQYTHPGGGFGGLRENPGDRRETDQQNSHQHQQTGEQPVGSPPDRQLILPQMRISAGGNRVVQRIGCFFHCCHADHQILHPYTGVLRT